MFSVVFHRLSHDSTKLVGVRNYSHTLLENNAPVQIIVYDTLPCYIIEVSTWLLNEITWISENSLSSMPNVDERHSIYRIQQKQFNLLCHLCLGE